MISLNNVKNFINSGSERTKIVKKNAVASLLIKLISMLVDFAKVPILLSYLDSERYGLYLTIASIVYWAHNFDFGLGTGLRYKLTSAISQDNYKYGKQLVSTAYLSMSAIMLGLLLVLLPVISFLDWNYILNTQLVGSTELILCVSIVLSVFVIQFILELITYVLQAYQRAAFASVFKPLSNLVTLICVLLLKFTTTCSLLYACVAMTVPIVAILLICNIYIYKHKFKEVKPSIDSYHKCCLKDIYSLGLKFFVSQSANLVVFQTASFLIAHYVNPSEAASYNTAFTYFGIIVVFNTMMILPLTAAVTDAYTKGDYLWISYTMAKINKVSVLLTLLSIILLAISPLVFKIWIGDRLTISWILRISMTIYFILNIWTTPYSSFISGVGKMNIAMAAAIFKIILYLPVSIVLVKFLGTNGIMLSIIFINTLPNNILYHIQYNKVMNKTATGIWNK